MKKFLYQVSNLYNLYRKNSKKLNIIIYLAILLIGGFAVYKVFNPYYIGRGGITITPTFPNEENSHYFTYEGKPGDIINDSLTLSNYAKNKRSVTIVGLDTKENSNSENFALKSRYDTQEMVGTWISFEENKSEFEIESGKAIKVGFKISIPKNVENRDYWGGLAAIEIAENNSDPNVAVEVLNTIRVNINVSDNPKLLKKLEEDPLKLYWKYIITSIIITSSALIIILFAQITPPKK